MRCFRISPPQLFLVFGTWFKSKRGSFPYLGITRGIPNHLAVKQALHFQFAPNFYFLHLRYGIQKKDGVVIHLHFLLQYPFPKKNKHRGDAGTPWTPLKNVCCFFRSQSSPGNCFTHLRRSFVARSAPQSPELHRIRRFGVLFFEVDLQDSQGMEKVEKN